MCVSMSTSIQDLFHCLRIRSEDIFHCEINISFLGEVSGAFQKHVYVTFLVKINKRLSSGMVQWQVAQQSLGSVSISERKSSLKGNCKQELSKVKVFKFDNISQSR